MPENNDEDENYEIGNEEIIGENELLDDSGESPEEVGGTIDFPKYEGECKYFHQDPYHTPNNYDLTFDHNNIPSNIQIEPASALQHRLQKLMPTSKIIHINIGANQINQTNFLRINSRMKVNNQEVNLK